MSPRHDTTAQPDRADTIDVLVIGGGPTGLGAAARLEQCGADYLLVEETDRVGGAAAAVTDARGFSWSVAGASGTQWNAVAERIVDPTRLWLDTRVAHVDISRRTAIFADGRAVRYRACISSAPLTTALSWAGARDLGVGLRSRRVFAVGLGFRGDEPAGLAAALSAESAAWSRLTAATELAPADHWSVVAELTVPARADIDTAWAIDRVLGGLSGFGATPSAPVSTWTQNFAPAFPETSDDDVELLRDLDTRLRAHGFLSRGLLGGWSPQASDLTGAYQQGGAAADVALDGMAEGVAGALGAAFSAA